MVHFSYFGFDWLPYPNFIGIYFLFILLFLSSIGLLLGFLYRISANLFFVSFTYIELLDKTYYLNHYYFVSLVGFLLIFLPAHRFFSLDVKLGLTKPLLSVPWWTINLIKFQLGLVYFYAGLAKINQDWLLNAMPLKIWLPANNQMPILGWLFNFEWTAYFFSWAGMAFDTIIPFALLNKKFRPYAYIAILIFHSITGYLFQIGMFPLIMSACVLVFFSDDFHFSILKILSPKIVKNEFQNVDPKTKPVLLKKITTVFLIFYIFLQLVFPWRYLLYPDNLFWTEEGYRFSWRVMLMEKAGTATFFIKDLKNNKTGEVDNSQFLNRHQEKQMAMQPDMILQFAHFLGNYYAKKGLDSTEVYVQSYVTINGRRSQLLIDSSVNLLKEKENLWTKKWILSLD